MPRPTVVSSACPLVNISEPAEGDAVALGCTLSRFRICEDTLRNYRTSQPHLGQCPRTPGPAASRLLLKYPPSCEPPSCRSNTTPLHEGPSKVALIGKSTFDRDFGKRKSRVVDEHAGLSNALIEKPSIGRNSNSVRESLNEIRRREPAGCSDVGYRHLIRKSRAQHRRCRVHLPSCQSSTAVSRLRRRPRSVTQQRPGRTTSLARIHTFPVAIATSSGLRGSRQPMSGDCRILFDHHRLRAGHLAYAIEGGSPVVPNPKTPADEDTRPHSRKKFCLLRSARRVGTF